MKNILVMNPKGGSGKTTLATNLASYYALWEIPTALIDYDPQRSSLDWEEQRSDESSSVVALDGSKNRIKIDPNIQRVVMDAPAKTNAIQIRKLISLADVLLVPVLPSPIDIRAVGYFLGTLVAENYHKKVRVGFVANKVNEQTIVFNKLKNFLKSMDVPFISSLRDTQNYIRAAETGSSIFEMPPYLAEKDVEQWRPIINWIEKN